MRDDIDAGRALARYLPQRDYARIKAATRGLVDATGGPEAASHITRFDKGRLSRVGALHEGAFMPLDVVADLEADCGQPIVTRALADLAGFWLMPKPGTRVPERADWVAMLGGIGSAAGGLIGELSDALADDGKVDAREAKAIRAGLIEAQRVLNELDAALKRHAEA